MNQSHWPSMSKKAKGVDCGGAGGFFKVGKQLSIGTAGLETNFKREKQKSVSVGKNEEDYTNGVGLLFLR